MLRFRGRQQLHAAASLGMQGPWQHARELGSGASFPSLPSFQSLSLLLSQNSQRCCWICRFYSLPPHHHHFCTFMSCQHSCHYAKPKAPKHGMQVINKEQGLQGQGYHIPHVLVSNMNTCCPQTTAVQRAAAALTASNSLIFRASFLLEGKISPNQQRHNHICPDTTSQHGAAQQHLDIRAVIFHFEKPLRTHPRMDPQNVGPKHCAARWGRGNKAQEMLRLLETNEQSTERKYIK